MRARTAVLLGILPAWLAGTPATVPDESVFVKGLRPGVHEQLLYVWTSDADVKDPDYIAVIDVDPMSPTYAKVIGTASTETTNNEAHHFGYTVDANRIFAGGLFSNRLFIYDVKTDPRRPKLVRTVPDLAAASGYSGPHTFYAVPGGVMIAMLGSKDGGAPGGLATFDNDANFKSALAAPNYMYDVGVKPELNRMVSSAWAHPQHIMAGPVPPEQTGDEVVVWDFKTGKILQVEHLEKAPLEVRWMHGPTARGGFIDCLLGNSVWYWEEKDGKLVFTRVIQFPDGALPPDMRISYDNRYLYVSLFGANAVEQYDITNPLKPKFVSRIPVPHPNMMKLSPDSRRLYITNSVLSNVDGNPPDYGVWMARVGPEGMQLDDKFFVDFNDLPSGKGRPHDMLLK